MVLFAVFTKVYPEGVVPPVFLYGPKVSSFAGLFGSDPAYEIKAEFLETVSEVGSILSLSYSCG